MFHINKKNNKGQTIIEAVIALASILLTLTAISIAIGTSLNNSEFLKNQSLASKYAQQGMEQVRYLKNSSPQSFDSYIGVQCMGEDKVLVPGGCNPANQGAIIDNLYKREIEFVHGSSECGTKPTTAPSSPPESGIQVKVSVYWSSSKCGSSNTFCHQSQLVSCFSSAESANTL